MDLLQRHLMNERPPALDFSKTKSRTKQSFKDEANVNNIMAQYVRTGVMPAGNRQPKYGDFSTGEDLRSVMDRVVAAELDFAALPSDIRTKFENSAVNLLDFLADPKNEEEAIALGLLPKSGEEPEPAPAPVEVSPATEETPET